MAAIDFSLINGLPSGAGKILTGLLSPTSGYYITEQQLADWIKGQTIVWGYYYNGAFYSDSGHTTPISPEVGVLYFDLTTDKDLYAWNGASYDPVSDSTLRQDILDGTVIAKKAKQDQNGNVIDQTYETKAEASDLKAAFEGYEISTNQRLENIETALNGTVVQPHVLTEPPSMANVRTITDSDTILPWAILKRVGARSVAWNQPIQNGNFASTQNWISNTPNEGPLSASSNIGKITLTSSVSSAGIYQKVNTISGHIILIHFRYKVTTSVANPRVRVVFSNGGSGDEFTEECTSGVWHEVCRGIVLTNSWSRFYMLSSYGVTYATGDTFEFSDVFLHDLTAMNESSLTADQFRALFPASYYPYNDGSIINLNSTGFKVVGKNKVSSLGGGYFNDADFNTTGSTSVFKNVKVYLDAGQYTISFSRNVNINRMIDGGILTSNIATNVNSYTFTTNGGWVGLSFRDPASSSTPWDDTTTVQLEIGSSATAYEPFSETTIDTSFMAGKKYVNPNCHDYSENVYVDGVLRRKDQQVVGYVDLGSLTYEKKTTGVADRYRFIVSFPDAKPAPSLNDPANAVCSRYEVIGGYPAYANNYDKVLAIDNNGVLNIYDSAYNSYTEADFKTAMSGIMLYYEKATLPDPTYGNPIPNFPCEDGTTITAVTPQTEVVNAIDVPNTIAYMTQITA